MATLPCGSFPGCYSRVKCNSLGSFCFQTMENSSLLDPCFHQGYQRTINTSDLFKTPCTSAKKKQLPFSQLYIQGEGNYQKCRRNIQELFNKTDCPYSSCSFNGIYLPPLHGDFGVSLHILQLPVTRNIRKAETQSNARVYSPWLGQEIIYKMAFWTCNYKSSVAFTVRTAGVGATLVNTGLPVPHCSHSNPSPVGISLGCSIYQFIFQAVLPEGQHQRQESLVQAVHDALLLETLSPEVSGGTRS